VPHTGDSIVLRDFSGGRGHVRTCVLGGVSRAPLWIVPPNPSAELIQLVCVMLPSLSICLHNAACLPLIPLQTQYRSELVGPSVGPPV